MSLTEKKINKHKSNFDAYAKYYEDLYFDKNYIQEAKYISSLIKKYQPKAKKILDYGCGSGKHSKILGDLGYQILGIEKSAEMARIAIKENKIQVVNKDILSFRSNEKFDVVISLFHVLNYITTKQNLSKIFKNISSNIKTGGIVIFDSWYTPAVDNIKPSTRIKMVKGGKNEIIRISEPEYSKNKAITEVNFTIFAKKIESKKWEMFSEKHIMKSYDIDEIEEVANLNGFKIIKKNEFMSLKKPSKNTWSVLFVLKKIN